MYKYTLAALSQLLDKREISSEELTHFYLNRIEQNNTELNCFITVTPEIALSQAKAADLQISKKQHSPLTGIPIAHKDIFCTSGIKTSCGSRMLDNFIPSYNATVVDQLNQQGMVCLGKTNMDEFAMGSSTETSFYGPSKNPWDPSKVPGGSSGGSGSAVSARLIPAATGTDTGGSIRQPAALCGVTGLKPTYGTVSRFGMIAFASSLDQGGPMTQTAEDAAMLLNAMAGFDSKDSTSLENTAVDYTNMLNNSIDGIKIGIPKQYFNDEIDEQNKISIEDAIRQFEKAGAKILEIDLTATDLSIPAYYVVAPAEASSNLSRYDGVRFGYRCKQPKDLLDLYCRSRGEGFGNEVKRRIMIGAYVLSSGYYDAYYLKAQKIRRLIRDDFQQAFQSVDVIMGPTTPAPAFSLNKFINDPIRMYLSDIFTVSVNLAGLPAISIPAGFSSGLPIGLQIIGNYFSEPSILNIAHQFQTLTDWHKQIPEGFN
ncbi:MAG: aspartyl-tRNA(Asn)/glutamyl-tRNA(Gln) amidotransferase subunit A [Gammaproteobacteria bacterium]|jgi:aspartyl-tRNA(Asn)/glutamyl-tRNA(Gln) amidotransferase subunit A